MGEHLYTYDDPPSERDLDRVCAVLERSGVIAYPIEQSWAFGCDARDHKALERIRRLKPGHPKEQPFSLICFDMAMASEVGNIGHQMYRYLKKAWPGPYTVLLKRNRSLPRQIKDRRPVVGIRIPDSPLILRLVEKLGRPLATASIPALESGDVLRMGYQIQEVFGHALDILLDLGDELPCLETTVIDLTDGAPELIREGVGDPSIFGIT